MKQEISKVLSDLIAFESTQEKPGEKKKAIDYADKWFKKNKIKTKKYPHKDSPSLVAAIPGKVKKHIFLLAHLDVVLADKEQFKPRIKAGKLAGRGALDDKGPAAMIMLAMKELSRGQERPGVTAVFTTDEEIGGAEGVARLAKLGVFKEADLFVVPDGGAPDTVVCKEKGIIHFTIEARGQAAHGSRPWLGDNAIDKLIAAIAEVKKIFKNANTRAANHWHPTINVGNIQGGQSINQVPDRARAGIDLRFTEDYKIPDLLKEINKAIKGKARIVEKKTGEILDSDSKHPLVKQYCRVVGQATGKKIKIKPEHGASDARHLNYLRKPVIIHYPKGGQLHAPGEWVSLDSLSRMGEGVVKFVRSVG